jgi:ABC-2 type transport system ATP-binding protein
MLKNGKVVALDTTAALIKRISGSMLVLHLRNGGLPQALRAQLLHPDAPEGDYGSPNTYALRINDYAEIEPILAAVRLSGAIIEEMQLQQADLEDVFLQIMDGEVVR